MSVSIENRPSNVSKESTIHIQIHICINFNFGCYDEMSVKKYVCNKMTYFGV